MAYSRGLPADAIGDGREGVGAQLSDLPGPGLPNAQTGMLFQSSVFDHDAGDAAKGQADGVDGPADGQEETA